MDFTGQVAIVTGGSTGIGRATAELLAGCGAAVLIGYVGKPADAEDTIRTIEAKGGRAAAFFGDISVVANIKAMFTACEQQFGQPDILIANAGLSESTPFLEITEEDFHRVYNVNVKGTLFCVQEAGRRLKDGGRIVVISSSTVRHPVDGMAVYTSSKSALLAMVEVAASELANRGITVNTILPGLTGTQKMFDGLPADFIKMVTDATPLGRLGRPDDVAQAIALLASKESQWISGQHIVANGGGKF